MFYNRNRFSINLIVKYLIKVIIFSFAFKATARLSNSHWDAELYKKNSIKLQQATAESILSKIDFRGNEKILDIGCGDGKITATLSAKVPLGYVIGFDVSPDMIKLAKQLTVSNTKFMVGNAEDFRINNKFDYIFSFFCIQWVKDKQKAFHEISNHLKEDGHVHLIMTNRNPNLLSVRTKMFGQEKWKKYFKDYQDPTNVIDNNNYKEYAKNAKLQDVTVKKFTKTVNFDSLNELTTFIRMVTPPINLLPNEDLKSQFINELTEGYLNHIKPINDSKNYIQYNIYYLSKVPYKTYDENQHDENQLLGTADNDDY